MAHLVLFMAIVLPLLMAAAFLLGRHLHRRQYGRDELSPVTRQHIDLFQGGQLSEAAVESAKARFRILLERGQVAAVEASLRPGMGYVVQVRALAEIGTDDAGRILERQLDRRLTQDQLEQSWYWIDLAHSLRSLNRDQSLPHLLRCAEAAGDIPLGHFFAAETVCFLGFAGYLQQPDTALGCAALRVLHRALEGLRYGVQPHVVAEGRLGEVIEGLWDHRPDPVHPLVVRVFGEVLRVLRRSGHAEKTLADEPSEQDAFHWQMLRLTALEEAFQEYLHEAPGPLRAALSTCSDEDQRNILHALADLRAEAGADLLPLLEQPHFAHPETAIDILSWSRDPRVGPWLRTGALHQMAIHHRQQRRRYAWPSRQRSADQEGLYLAILRALRGHAARETEAILLLAARDRDPVFRAAAIGSLGWWEPVERAEVLLLLQAARKDAHVEIRQSARAALARLGERLALQWFRQGLHGDEPQQVHETIQMIANEGLTLLWPDLDRLTDADDGDVAHLAREALERLSEEWIRSPS